MVNTTDMSYFSDHYADLSYPIASDQGPGLYNAQLGAIHALVSHYTVEERPAIVTMPTGSGKTAVLMMLPYALKSARVLVITPRRLVRGQISEDFEILRTLKDIAVVPSDIDPPRVLELESRIRTAVDWESLRNYDVVVSTPNCVSPGHEDIPRPPQDLFDLVLVDEAHHSPARTWTELLASLPTAKRALFSATPFRRDRAEIPGRFVYSYPISLAFDDGIFGSISYIQVDPAEGQNSDVAIARQTAEVFAADRAAGLNHFVMVRTDRKTRADALKLIYDANTQLRLKVVHSGLSNGVVRRILQEMERAELDGIICVNMMGEGFNFPRLKIAAIHTPHKSLEVTLQFIGRFARTNAADIGEAKFIAVLSEIEIERKRLFDEGAVWQDIIPALSYGKIENEIHIREVIDEFETQSGVDERFDDLSLYSLNPRSHVKIFDISEPIDLRIVDLPELLDKEICFQSTTADGSALIVVTRTRSAPKWSAGDTITNVAYELLVIFYDSETRLLFINSSKSSDGTYENLIKAISPTAMPLPTRQVRKVVREIQNKRIFNIGMRNIQGANTRESYKIVAASDAQVDPADARRYRQGHVFLSGEEAGERKTIGYSSGSKVWSSANNQIPILIDWCKILGSKIRSDSPLVTNSGLDYLDAGEKATSIPENLIYVQWNRNAFDFTNPVHVEYAKEDGARFSGHILDLDLQIDRENSNGDRIRVNIVGDGLVLPVSFSLADFFTAVNGDGDHVTVVRGSTSDSLIDFLNEFYLDFYTADGSLFSGNEIFEPKEDALPIDMDQLTVWDWTGVDIDKEVTAPEGHTSVHDKVKTELERTDAAVILYDHGTGEIADFVTITEFGDETAFTFYHCKGSGSATAGARVDDVYEVSGQAQKSVAWAGLSRFEQRIHYKKRKTNLIRGTPEALQQILERAKSRRQRFDVKIVQPGISKATISAGMAECLGATSGHLRGFGLPRLEIIGSA